MVPLNTGTGTYMKHSGTLSSLDIAMTTANLAKVTNWNVRKESLGSDHLVVEMAIRDRPVPEQNSIPKWSYRRGDLDGFKKDCIRLLTSDIVVDDIKVSRDGLVDAIIDAAELNIPVVNSESTSRRYTAVPYWTDDCTAAINKRNKAKNKMQRTKDLENRKKYYCLRGIAQHTIKEAEKTYWCDFCSNMNKDTKAGKVWRTIKKMSGAQSRLDTSTIVDDGISYDTNQSKAELFAKKFAAASSNENFSPEFQANRTKMEEKWQTEDDQPAVPLAINQPFEVHELVDAVKICKRKTAPGPDHISYEMLKNIPILPNILRFFI